MRQVVAVLVPLLVGSPGQGQDRVIGLLTLPDVFGPAVCAEFEPAPTALFAAPDSSSPVGWIRTDRRWTQEPAGGCTGLEVNVHRAAGVALPLPAQEYDYEAPAAVVLERRGLWYRIRDGGTGSWLHATSRSEFLSLESLLPERLTYLTAAWDGRLRSAPGAPASARLEAGERAVRVTEVRRIADAFWVEVEVLAGSPCEVAEPGVAARGWVPAHASSGESVVWFHARGC